MIRAWPIPRAWRTAIATGARADWSGARFGHAGDTELQRDVALELVLLERIDERPLAQFAREARAMHLGDAPERAIYGEAKPDEAKALIEDGIPVAPLPFRPGRKSN